MGKKPLFLKTKAKKTRRVILFYIFVKLLKVMLNKSRLDLTSASEVCYDIYSYTVM